MEEVKTNNNSDAKVVASLLGDCNNKVARYLRVGTNYINFEIFLKPGSLMMKILPNRPS